METHHGQLYGAISDASTVLTLPPAQPAHVDRDTTNTTEQGEGRTVDGVLL